MDKHDLQQRIADLSPEKRERLKRRVMEMHLLASRAEMIPRRGTSGPCALSFAQPRDHPGPPAPELLLYFGHRGLSFAHRAFVPVAHASNKI